MTTRNIGITEDKKRALIPTRGICCIVLGVVFLQWSPCALAVCDGDSLDLPHCMAEDRFSDASVRSSYTGDQQPSDLKIALHTIVQDAIVNVTFPKCDIVPRAYRLGYKLPGWREPKWVHTENKPFVILHFAPRTEVVFGGEMTCGGSKVTFPDIKVTTNSAAPQRTLRVTDVDDSLDTVLVKFPCADWCKHDLHHHLWYGTVEEPASNHRKLKLPPGRDEIFLDLMLGKTYIFNGYIYCGEVVEKISAAPISTTVVKAIESLVVTGSNPPEVNIAVDPKFAHAVFSHILTLTCEDNNTYPTTRTFPYTGRVTVGALLGLTSAATYSVIAVPIMKPPSGYVFEGLPFAVTFTAPKCDDCQQSALKAIKAVQIKSTELANVVDFTIELYENASNFNEFQISYCHPVICFQETISSTESGTSRRMRSLANIEHMITYNVTVTPHVNKGPGIILGAKYATTFKISTCAGRCAVLYGSLTLKLVNYEEDFVDIKVDLPAAKCTNPEYTFQYESFPEDRSDRVEFGASRGTQRKIDRTRIKPQQKDVVLKGFFYWEDIGMTLRVDCGGRPDAYHGRINTGPGPTPHRISYVELVKFNGTSAVINVFTDTRFKQGIRPLNYFLVQIGPAKNAELVSLHFNYTGIRTTIEIPDGLQEGYKIVVHPCILVESDLYMGSPYNLTVPNKPASTELIVEPVSSAVHVKWSGMRQPFDIRICPKSWSTKSVAHGCRESNCRGDLLATGVEVPLLFPGIEYELAGFYRNYRGVDVFHRTTFTTPECLVDCEALDNTRMKVLVLPRGSQGGVTICIDSSHADGFDGFISTRNVYTGEYTHKYMDANQASYAVSGLDSWTMYTIRIRIRCSRGILREDVFTGSAEVPPTLRFYVIPSFPNPRFYVNMPYWPSKDSVRFAFEFFEIAENIKSRRLIGAPYSNYADKPHAVIDGQPYRELDYWSQALRYITTDRWFKFVIMPYIRFGWTRIDYPMSIRYMMIPESSYQADSILPLHLALGNGADNSVDIRVLLCPSRNCDKPKYAIRVKNAFDDMMYPLIFGTQTFEVLEPPEGSSEVLLRGFQRNEKIRIEVNTSCMDSSSSTSSQTYRHIGSIFTGHGSPPPIHAVAIEPSTFSAIVKVFFDDRWTLRQVPSTDYLVQWCRRTLTQPICRNKTSPFDGNTTLVFIDELSPGSNYDLIVWPVAVVKRPSSPSGHVTLRGPPFVTSFVARTVEDKKMEQNQTVETSPFSAVIRRDSESKHYRVSASEILRAELKHFNKIIHQESLQGVGPETVFSDLFPGDDYEYTLRIFSAHHTRVIENTKFTTPECFVDCDGMLNAEPLKIMVKPQRTLVAMVARVDMERYCKDKEIKGYISAGNPISSQFYLLHFTRKDLEQAFHVYTWWRTYTIKLFLYCSVNRAQKRLKYFRHDVFVRGPANYLRQPPRHYMDQPSFYQKICSWKSPPVTGAMPATPDLYEAGEPRDALGYFLQIDNGTDGHREVSMNAPRLNRTEEPVMYEVYECIGTPSGRNPECNRGVEVHTHPLTVRHYDLRKGNYLTIHVKPVYPVSMVGQGPELSIVEDDTKRFCDEACLAMSKELKPDLQPVDLTTETASIRVKIGDSLCMQKYPRNKDVHSAVHTLLSYATDYGRSGVVVIDHTYVHTDYFTIKDVRHPSKVTVKGVVECSEDHFAAYLGVISTPEQGIKGAKWLTRKIHPCYFEMDWTRDYFSVHDVMASPS